VANTRYQANQMVTKSNTLLSAKVDFISGSSFSLSNWNVISAPLSQTIITGTGSFTIPDTVSIARIVAVGAGSGGGGGGSALNSGGVAAQVGGGGGGSGAFSVYEGPVTPGDVLTIQIGTGGAGGAGGAANGNPGINGSNGANTIVTGTGISVTGKGSLFGGRLAAANSTASVNGGIWGQEGTSISALTVPCSGGTSGSNGTGPLGYSSGGGGGGGAANSATAGGLGGGAGIATAGGALGTTAGSGTVNGGNGANASANTGAGGGGGGGGAATGTGGTGGTGGSGFVVWIALG
jgi:hypothetical protein